MSNIKAVKLVTGEDLICDIAEGDDYLLSKDSVQVIPMPGQGAETRFMFIPFPITSKDEEIVIKKDKIVYVATPLDQFLMQYNEKFGKIVTPPSGIILK